MSIHDYLKASPAIDASAHLFEGAHVVGDVTLGKEVSVWFNTVIRGDVAPVIIGDHTNVQDGTVIHTDTDFPTIIGKNVTIGHSAVVHACTVEDNALIGMHSTILDGATVETGALVAAGTVVPPGKTVPKNTLVMGNPMKVVRELTPEELKANRENADHYIELMKSYKST
ncbi:MAG: gamma carbonic anhydrase family protein [Bacillota bacterium]